MLPIRILTLGILFAYSYTAYASNEGQSVEVDCKVENSNRSVNIRFSKDNLSASVSSYANISRRYENYAPGLSLQAVFYEEVHISGNQYVLIDDLKDINVEGPRVSILRLNKTTSTGSVYDTKLGYSVALNRCTWFPG